MYALLARSSHKIAALLAGAALLAVCMAASILFGAKAYSLNTLLHAYTAFDGSDAHLIIRTSRVPRALIAAVVGAALAVAGAIMQALTRNPLASPSLFGVNSGSGLALVAAVALFGSIGLGASVWIAFAGAALSAAAVYVLGSGPRGEPVPVNMTLAGAAIAAFASSLTSGVLLGSNKTLDQVFFWLIGSVAGRELTMLTAVLPYVAAGFVAAFALAAPLNLLAMGEDVAVSLGQRTAHVKLGAAAAIVVLAGGAVAVAGPIGFVGIIIPHIARYLVGRDHRWLLPYCAVLGAILLVAADLGSRFLLMPGEVPVGVLTVVIGVPFFVMIARRGRYAE